MQWLEMYITYLDSSNNLPVSTKRIFVNPQHVVAVSGARRAVDGTVLSLNIVFSNNIVPAGIHYEFAGDNNMRRILADLGLENVRL